MNIVITGTSAGIGKFLATTFLERGHFVIGLNRSKPDVEHPNFYWIQTDLSKIASVSSAIKAIGEKWRNIDVLINNAGIGSMNHTLFTDLGTVDKVFAVNTIAPFALIQGMARLMRDCKDPRIVNVSTVAVPLRISGEAVYAASKAALESLTRIIAHELAPFGITINAVGPTPIDTNLIRSVPPLKISGLLKRQAIERMGTFEDIVNVVDFFLRPESNFVTGQVIYLGGVS